MGFFNSGSTVRVTKPAKAARRTASQKTTMAISDAVVRLESRMMFAVFGTGDLAVYRVGTGTALTNAASPVIIDEYTPSGGSPVQSIALPTTVGTGSTINPLTASGTSANEGNLTLSADGKYLIVPGYSAVTGVQAVASLGSNITGTISAATNGTTSVLTSSSFTVSQFNGSSVSIANVGNIPNGNYFAKALSTTTFSLYTDPAWTTPVAGSGTFTAGGTFAGGIQREVGRIDGAGNINTTTTLGSVYGAASIRGAASPDGNTFYTTAGSGGLLTQTFGSNANASTASSTIANLRAVGVYNGVVYVSTGSGATRMDALSGTTLGALTGISNTSTPTFANPDQFAFASISGSTNPDTLYVIDQTIGIVKFSLVGGTWTSNGSLAAGTSPTGIVTKTVGGVQQLYISSPTTLYSLTDTGSSTFNSTLAGTLTTIATAPANTLFRGIAFAPTPPVINPVVTSITPTVGSTAGGTSVTITGNGFSSISGAGGVKFGGVNATSYVVNSYTSITAVAPAGSVGPVDVTVTNSLGTSSTGAGDQFTYTVSPTISSVSPSAGPLGGGTIVTITGSNFTATSTVQVGGVAATGIVFNSATSLTATVPAHAAGVTDVIVSNGAVSSSVVASDQFTYVAVPTVTGLSITSGLDGGQQTVTITGTGFVNVTGVTFGGVAGTAVTTVSSTSITVKTPAHAVGTVDVLVTAAGGTNAPTASDQFTFVLTTIAAAQAQAGANQLLTIDSGAVVTQIFERAGDTAPSTTGNNSVSYTRSAFFIQDSTGSAEIFFTATTSTTLPPPSYTPTVGDVITSVSGAWTPFQGVPELGNVTAITASGTGTVTTPPPTSTIPSLNVSSLSNSVLPNNLAGYVFTLKGVNINSTITGNATTFAKTTLTGSISDTASPKNTMALVYSISNNETAYSNLGDSTIPFNKLVDMTGYVDVKSGVPQFNVFSIVTTTAAPVVSGLTPASGATTGTNTITVNGNGFTDAYTNSPTVTGVFFGSNAGSNVTVLSNTQLTVTVPAGAAGSVHVTVASSNGTSATSAADLYTYTTTPVVSSLSPAGGPTVGGTSVIITGGNFLGATSVTFGGTAATFTITDDQHITATTPAHAAGVVDVIVVKGTVSSPAQTSDNFTYAVAPAVTSLSPTSGSDLGGTSVVITGTGFGGTTAVTFGGVAATSFTVNSTTQITAIAPASTAGVKDVVVINPAGSSPTVVGDQFTYNPASIADAEAQATGTVVKIETNPVVTKIVSVGGSSNNDFAYANWAFLIQDASGSLEVFGPLTGLGYTPVVGDTIAVTGTYAPFNQIPELGGAAATAITSLTKTGTSGTIPGDPVPLSKTISQINSTTLSLANGGHLITVNNVTISGVPSGTTTFGNLQVSYTLTDSSGTNTLFYDPKNYSVAYDNLFGTTIPTGPVAVTGIVSIFANGGSPVAELIPISIGPAVVTAPAWLSAGSVYSSYTPGGSISISSGTIIADPAASGDGSEAITVTGTLNTNLPSGTTSIHVGSMNISAGASFALRPSASTLSVAKPILLTSGISIATTGKLDLANGFLDLVGGSASAVNTLVKTGYAGGAMTGTGGIYSSVAAADPTKLTTIGVRTATAAGTLDGASYATGDVLLKYTYYGDADISGAIDGSDYSRIDAAFVGNTGTGWFNGDYNYDNVINGSDYTLMDNAYNRQGTAFPSASIAAAAKPAAAIAPVASVSTDSFFSEKKVKASTLFSEVEDLITA